MAILSFEHKAKPLASKARFAGRLLGNLTVALTAIVVALAGGMAGYHYIVGLDWLASFLNAAMILGGMGPVATEQLKEPAAAIFAGGYALFCGLLFVAIAGVILAPLLHRMLHALHVKDD